MAFPPQRPDGLIDRPFRYHMYDDFFFDMVPKFDFISLQVPKIGARNPGDTERLSFYSLKRDLAELRAIGGKKTITPAGGGGTAKPLVDVSVDKIGVASEDDPDGKKRELCAIKLGVGSDHKVLITGCHHAREWISVEVPYLIAEYLVLNFDDNPTTDKLKRIKHLLLNRQIWIVPMVNPDGHAFTITDDREWRTNRAKVFVAKQTIPAPQLKLPGKPALKDRNIDVLADATFVGVDINRNYPTSSSSLFPWGQETYFPGTEGLDGGRMTSRDPKDCGAGPGQRKGVWTGMTAGSELESRAVVALMNANPFRAAMSYHSFSEDLLFPDDAEKKKDVFSVGVAKGMSDVNKSAKLHFYKAIKGSALYPDTGDLLDFTYDKFPGRPSILPEVRPDDKKANEAKQFSGLPESEIFDTFAENLGPALALINCAGFNNLSASTTCTWKGQSPVCQVVRNCWEVFLNWQP
jgi:carboxypeptidase T